MSMCPFQQVSDLDREIIFKRICRDTGLDWQSVRMASRSLKGRDLAHYESAIMTKDGRLPCLGCSCSDFDASLIEEHRPPPSPINTRD